MNARAGPDSPPRRGARRRGDAADHFRLLADYAPVMIWVAGPDRKSVYFNRPWLAFTGRPLDAELGFGWLAGVHPDDRERVASTYGEAFERREPFETEYRLRRHDGEFRWLLDKGVPLVFEQELSGFVGSCVDLTDRLRAEQEARKRERDFKTLAENIPDVIARLDRSLRCVYANRAVAQAFGAGPDVLAGKRLAETRLPSSMVQVVEAAALEALRGGEERPFHVEIDSPEGPPRHFDGRIIPEHDAQGQVEAVLLVAYDVTARTREDERRAQMLARERSARADAESATLARDQFLAIVSHELRSPLNGIKSWTHVLENQLRDPDPTVRRAIKGIMIGVEHQVRLIEDLLDVTRAISGNLGLVKQPMALLPVLADAVESLRATALEKGVALETDYAIGDREIHGDADRVRQVFVNLVCNAIKFTPPGGTISISAAPDGAMGRIEVRDDGAGIAPEFLPFVFDPFRQGEQAGTSRRSQEGLGLGLALVQRLVELHGGHVTCESDGPQRGSTFRVYLPLRRDSAARVTVEPAGSAAASTLPALNGIHVMLIDDQREARESLATLLSQAGAQVATASSCHEALAHLAIADDHGEPEVIVCDIAMPGQDGYETLRRIRAWEAGRGPRARRRPAIAVSAFNQREDRMRALSEGFQMHLAKPVAPAELIIVISGVARGMRV